MRMALPFLHSFIKPSYSSLVIINLDSRRRLRLLVLQRSQCLKVGFKEKRSQLTVLINRGLLTKSPAPFHKHHLSYNKVSRTANAIHLRFCSRREWVKRVQLSSCQLRTRKRHLKIWTVAQQLLKRGNLCRQLKVNLYLNINNNLISSNNFCNNNLVFAIRFFKLMPCLRPLNKWIQQEQVVEDRKPWRIWLRDSIKILL